MKIPFSIDEFLTVFENYNRSLWPVQLVLHGLAFIVIGLVIMNRARSNRMVYLILAFLWVWMGLVYHIFYFSAINKAAYLFGVVFIIQGFIFLYFGAIKQKMELKAGIKLFQSIGIVFIAYSLILYPLLGYSLGHVYPRSPTFGVPCPTTIFTFGLLLFSVNRIPWFVIIIPFLWSVIGFFAAISLSIREDFGLVIAGVIASGILLFLKSGSQKT
jgi:ammonia channel protein AmtB